MRRAPTGGRGALGQSPLFSRRLSLLFVCCALGFVGLGLLAACGSSPDSAAPSSEANAGEVEQVDGDKLLARAFAERLSGIEVEGKGTVVRVLPDDLEGSRHQRFVIRLDSGQTLLVAHNIDLSPRLRGITVRDTVWFHGEYAWNSEGGTIHWTHRDPNGVHEDGWLRHRARIYE